MIKRSQEPNIFSIFFLQDKSMSVKIPFAYYGRSSGIFNEDVYERLRRKEEL